MLTFYPTYPEIPWTREVSNQRQPGPILLQCRTCKHSVDFHTEAEQHRFMVTSGWKANMIGAFCPVCQS